jgi:pyrroline-5-carboxylate reductase
MTLISGPQVAEKVLAECQRDIAALKARGVTPGLAVVLVGDDPASRAYVRSKDKKCRDLGLHSVKLELPATTSQDELLEVVAKLNADPAIHGILVQSPPPKQIDEAAIVRAMPNTPAAVRQGFTVAYAAPGVTAAQKSLADALLQAVGEVAWVEDEDQINPVTAVSGGGPAYVFLLAEVMEKAAIEQGLPPDLARRMARATVAGSGALLAASPQDAADLRRAVTSPKGTTERALAVLMDAAAWPAAMSKAIQAATDRARELAG